MPRKKKRSEEELNYPEFGYVAKDEEDVLLVVESNAGKDNHKYLEYAKKLNRPILVSIESVLFDNYKFKNFALTKKEAVYLAKELNRMVEHLEDD